MSNKAIKYRLYPTEAQATLFRQTFGCCRKVWNLMLADRKAYYKRTKKTLKVTPAQYKTEYPFLKDVDSLALANVQMSLQQAYSNYFDHIARFPKFKSAKKSRKSYTTNAVNGNVVLLDNAIKLPKVGLVETKIHRKPQDNWKLKSVTVSLDGDGKYYASVLFEFDSKVSSVAVSDNAIGLDYSSKELYVDSNGNVGSVHKYFRQSQQKIAKAQRKLKHKKKDSKNYNKQQQRINKLYKKTANRRADSLHKLSTKIANSYDIVCVETLNLQEISAHKVHGKSLGKATMDNGYGMFLRMLEYKLNDRGKFFVKVDKLYPSSQKCSGCGLIHKEMKDLSVRTMNCECGLSIDRDRNAAINILQEGLRLLSQM